MPIECDMQANCDGEEKFRQLDSLVTGIAYGIHNDMGRLMDERIYQVELAARLAAAGVLNKREFGVRAVHRDYTKLYRIDLLAGNSFIYELKATESITTAHQSQLIHYLLLLNLHHGKIINFRPTSVESRFVSTQLTLEQRRAVVLCDAGWDGSDSDSTSLRFHLMDLIKDWGACLSLELYRSALLHFLKGPGVGLHSVEIISHGRTIGSQNMCLLDSDTAWHISAFRNGLTHQKAHLSRLLNFTRLKRIHWINLDLCDIAFTTLKKQS